jgi:hypothetical protein
VLRPQFFFFYFFFFRFACQAVYFGVYFFCFCLSFRGQPLYALFVVILVRGIILTEFGYIFRHVFFVEASEAFSEKIAVFS